MNLTPSQTKALKLIDKWQTERKMPYHHEKAKGTYYAIRSNVLEVLMDKGLIHSARPFHTFFHSVTLTEAGAKIAEETP